ncbi:MAG: sulfotransferase domain-containing protein [Acidimicrobiia bacterium]
MARVRYQSFLTDSARWDGFAFRPGDIIISTPAKCGTTWTQMICALLIFQTPELPQSLDRLSPWIEMRLRRRRDVFDLYEAQTHRRFIKSRPRRLAPPPGDGGCPPDRGGVSRSI